MKKRFLWLSLMLISFGFSSFGQVVYSLTDCINISLDRNFSILISKNNESIAKNNFSLGNAGFLPSLDLTSKHSGTIYDIDQSNTDGTKTSSDGVLNTTTYGIVNADITLFNGFSVQTTYKKLNELKQQGELSTRLAIENLLGDLIAGYYNFIQQIEMVNNLKYAVTLSKERLRIDEDRYLLGSSSKLQVLQSRVYLNSDSSRLSKQVEVVRAARIRLNEMMAVEDLNLEFVTKDTSISINPDLVYEKLLEETMQQNTSLLISSGKKTISEYDYKLVKSRSYPYLDLNSGYNFYLNNYSNSTTDYQTNRGLSYGVTMGINLFNGFNQRRSIRNSALEVKNTELNYQEVEQGVKADLLTIYSAYTNYLRLVTLEKQNLQTATENLEIAMERYKLGSLSGIDLREVQKSLLDARESLVTVEYQAKLAEVSLLVLSGQVLDYY